MNRSGIKHSGDFHLKVFAQTAFLSKLGYGEELNFGFHTSGRNICSKFYLNSLSFTQNYLPVENICDPGFWSMAVTFQAHVMCVFIVWILLRFKSIGITLSVFLMMYCSALSYDTLNNLKLDQIIEAKKFNSAKEIENHARQIGTFFDGFYSRTISWSCPILMGILFAHMLPRIQRLSYSSRKIFVYFTTLLIIFLYSFLIMMTELMQNQTAFSLTMVITPVCAGLIVSIVIFIFHPKSQFISYKLSPETFPLLVHLSKISYPLYLTHWIVYIAILNTVKLTPTPDGFTTLCLIVGCSALVYMTSIWVYIFIEKPCQIIRKIYNL
ncbi:uncharacterized protein LOC141850627 isoform X2 [Brevipalpus obovatus]|uniref:uncharacterized protein LOC141850627 isoform X2 n=1 Tax=Brevipalpus obovatus TaxID=246614 RepID=UPI003D9F9142